VAHQTNESIHIIDITAAGTVIKQTLPARAPGIYATQIHSFYTGINKKKQTKIWLNRLGLPGNKMYHRILKDTIGVPRKKKP
jgi:hypothetical protein